MNAPLVVTRHGALVALLAERGIVPAGTVAVPHVSPDDVRGRHVIGVLPLHLAALAASVTEVPLDLAPEDRGVELGIERLRAIAGKPVTYLVRSGADMRAAVQELVRAERERCWLDAGAPSDPAPAVYAASTARLDAAWSALLGKEGGAL